jgi:5-methyltetrahydropteroyltriglutamate--homocysteine methyltransferase
MKSSTDRILTTHAGSLSRPPDLIAMGRARAGGEIKDDTGYAQCLAASVAGVVKKQRELGIDIPDDGEFGKPVGGSYDYGAWWNYAFARMSGFSPAGSPAAAAHETQHKKSTVADVALTSFANRRDWQKFGEFYLDPESSGSLMGSAARRPVGRPACTGPIKYTGHAARKADIDNLKKGDGRDRHGRRLHVLDWAGQLRPRRRSPLQDRHTVDWKSTSWRSGQE